MKLCGRAVFESGNWFCLLHFGECCSGNSEEFAPLVFSLARFKRLSEKCAHGFDCGGPSVLQSSANLKF